MHKGLVVKTNTNQRYATDAVSAFIMKQIAKEVDAPTQVRTNWSLHYEL